MQFKYRNILATALCSGAIMTQVAFAGDVVSIKDSGASVIGSASANNLNGTHGNDRILSGGVSSGAESIRARGGADRLVFTANDAVVPDIAAVNSDGHIRIRDLIIDNIQLNSEADSVSLGRLIGLNNLDANNIGDYLHIVSNGLFGWSNHRSLVFINLEGDFSSADRASLDADSRSSSSITRGGYGSDLVLEFQNEQGNNNFETLTGHPNNTVEQYQALIDMGFLELSVTDIYGSSGGDQLEGTAEDERIFSGGVAVSAESVRGNGGADRLIFEAGDLVRNGHSRVRDFVIDDIQLNIEADSVALGGLIAENNLDANNIGDYLHVVSGLYGAVRTAVFINLDGDFTAADRQALDTGSPAIMADHGAELLLEFQGQAANNNFETLTGFSDNTADQFQALIDWGFLEL